MSNAMIHALPWFCLECGFCFWAISKNQLSNLVSVFCLGDNARGFKFSDTACFDIQLTGWRFMHKLLCSFACKNSILYCCLVVTSVCSKNIFMGKCYVTDTSAAAGICFSPIHKQANVSSATADCCFTKKKTHIKMCPLRNKAKSIFVRRVL